jgi:hypothetical protein
VVGKEVDWEVVGASENTIEQDAFGMVLHAEETVLREVTRSFAYLLARAVDAMDQIMATVAQVLDCLRDSNASKALPCPVLAAKLGG